MRMKVTIECTIEEFKTLKKEPCCNKTQNDVIAEKLVRDIISSVKDKKISYL